MKQLKIDLFGIHDLFIFIGFVGFEMKTSQTQTNLIIKKRYCCERWKRTWLEILDAVQ